MRLADNHKGWNVEVFHRIKGWIPTKDKPYNTLEDAEKALKDAWPKEFEYRIYEAV